MDRDREWSDKQLILRENNFMHAPQNPEFDFYTSVKSGDIERVEKLCESGFVPKKGFGKLSDNPLRNVAYHFIVTAALLARFCVEGGMSHEEAYGLSDFYIQKADRCSDVEQISRLHRVMSIDYAKRMKQQKKDGIYSEPVVKCINYIYSRLHTRITLASLANYVHLNPNYLSRLFKKETGISASLFIQNQKVEASRNMLKYTDYSVSQISSMLSFPTQSYFIEVFKKQTGLTPKKYRDSYFGKMGADIKVMYDPLKDKNTSHIADAADKRNT